MKQDTKHTPGPWETAENGDNIRCAEGLLVAHTFGHLGQGQANGVLIASAPELLAMVKAANLAFYGSGTQKALQAVLKGSKDLIRKAEGRA